MTLVNTTIDYYNRNAQEYYDRTISADMSDALEQFTKYVRPGGRIVDVGCGSGRDIRYFLNAGFEAEGIDASEELCVLARESTGAMITCTTIQEWTPEHPYDGIWANASLLHMTLGEVSAFIERLPDMLTENGAAYMSFKSGIQTGVDAEGRYYSNMPLDTLRDMINATSALIIQDAWESNDALNRDGFTWINLIVASQTIHRD